MDGFRECKVYCFFGVSTMMNNSTSLLPSERVENCILFLHGQKVILSFHLAEMYGVEPRILVRNVKRNIDRFPEDFMFQLTDEEWKCLRSQFGIIEKGRGKYPKYLPYAFTEQGVAMLSSVLNSSRAILVNIEIMRAFVRLRGMMVAHADLVRKLDALEKKYDKQFAIVFEAKRQLMIPVDSVKKRPLGFLSPRPKSGV
jgi:hypothetical protein